MNRKKWGEKAMRKPLPKLRLSVLLVSLCLSLASAENLIFNSGFELGDCGFVVEKYLRPETNPGLEYAAPHVDRSTFTEGAQSLRLPNGYAESFDLQSREFQLTPGQWYTFSVDLKSSIDKYPVALSLVTVREFRRRTVKQQRQFVVGKEWKRYSFTFKAYPKESLKFYYVRLDNGTILAKDETEAVAPPAADLWLDNMQLVAGKSSRSAASAVPELAVVPTRKVVVKTGKSVEAEVMVRLHNPSAKTLRAPLVLTVSDRYTGAEIATVRKTVAIPAGKAVEAAVPIKLSKYGSYHLAASLEGLSAFNALPNNLAVVGKTETRPGSQSESFCVSLNGGLGRRVWAHKSGNVNTFMPGYRSVGHSPQEGLELMSQMGCRLLRSHSEPAFHWSVVEPEEGVFDFAAADRLVDLAAAQGIQIAPCLGDMEFMTRTWGGGKEAALPAWLQAKSPKSSYAPMLRKYRQTFIYLPPLELWQRYIRVLAERYKGRITHWEIMNEPNLFIMPEDYLTYLKAAHEVLKQVDAENKIIGFCATGDLGGAVNSFLGKSFSLGGLDYADIVAFHPYHARTLSSPKPADTMIAEAKALLAKFGKPDMPLWNTELYFLKEGDDSNYYAAEYLAHRFLTDLGEGVAQSISLQKVVMLAPAERYYQSLASENLQFPDSNFVIYNTMARLFTGAKPVAKLRWAVNSICYVFENNGRYLAAFWHYGNTPGLKLSLDLGASNADHYDLFGNPIAWNEQPLNLGAAPQYLVWKGSGPADFVEKLKKAKITGDMLLKLGASRLLRTPQGWQAAVGLHNLAGESANGKMTLSAPGLEFLAAPTFTIGGGTSQAVTVPVKVAGNFPDQIAVNLAQQGKHYQLNSTCFPRPMVYTVGKAAGKLEELRGEHFAGTAKHKARFSARYDDQFLYLETTVEDRTPSGKAAGRHPWQQDCVELMIDTQPASHLADKFPEAHHRQLVRLFVMPYAEHQLNIWRRGLTDLSVQNEVEILEGGYRIKLRVPLSQLGLSGFLRGQCLGFEILVDNVEGAAVDAVQLRWNSHGSAHKDRSEFGLLCFE
jgi:hypothetical protein